LFFNMNFPASWEVFEADQFENAVPRNTGEAGMELLTQVRPNGRVLDHFRITLGGSKIIDVSTPMATLFPGTPAAWKWRYQSWARDISIRRNMTSSVWLNAHTLLEAREAWVEAEEERISPEQVLQHLGDAKAAIRFAIVIGDNHGMELNIQGLPASAESLMGKPAFRG
jgi:hypothetical protein